MKQTTLSEPLDFHFFNRGVIVPKARPDVNTRTRVAYMPDDYRAFKENLARALGLQWEYLAPAGVRTVVRFSLALSLHGNHREGADLDNVIGTVLDAMKDARVIHDDKMKFCFKIAAEYHPSNDPPSYTVDLTAHSFLVPSQPSEGKHTDNPF